MKGQEPLFPLFLVEGQRTILGKKGPLVWGPDVEERVAKRARYQSTKFKASEEEKEDFVQECQSLVFRRCKEGKLDGYAGIEPTVARFAIDFFVRAGSRRPSTVQDDDESGYIDREPDQKAEIDYSLSILLEDFPLLSCVAILLGEGVSIDSIATAFGWDTQSLQSAYETDRSKAAKVFIDSSPKKDVASK